MDCPFDSAILLEAALSRASVNQSFNAPIVSPWTIVLRTKSANMETGNMIKVSAVPKRRWGLARGKRNTKQLWKQEPPLILAVFPQMNKLPTQRDPTSEAIAITW
jgi:hypothetical protein